MTNADEGDDDATATVQARQPTLSARAVGDAVRVHADGSVGALRVIAATDAAARNDPHVRLELAFNTSESGSMWRVTATISPFDASDLARGVRQGARVAADPRMISVDGEARDGEIDTRQFDGVARIDHCDSETAVVLASSWRSLPDLEAGFRVPAAAEEGTLGTGLLADGLDAAADRVAEVAAEHDPDRDDDATEVTDG